MEKIIFDAHAHYNDETFSDAEREKIIEDVFNTGVKYILNAGTNIITSKESIALAERYDGVYAAIGIYPYDSALVKDESVEIAKIIDLLRHPKVVAVGEIGLDYHYEDIPRDVQKKWFELQLDIAEQHGLPVIIHDREAHGDVMDILRRHPNVNGMLHSFSGSKEMALELTKLGWYISVSGVVTFKNASKIVEVVESLPMDKMLVETDTPYLSPVPNRGKPNNSANIWFTARRIAEIKRITVEEVLQTTLKNALDLFKI